MEKFQQENPFRRAQRRVRTRPLQRPVIIPDTDSSSDSDDGEYDSSSDPSRTVESSGSHASIVAEVHIPSHTAGPYPHRVNASSRGWGDCDRPQAAPATSGAQCATHSGELETSVEVVSDITSGPPTEPEVVTHSRGPKNKSAATDSVVNITTSCNSQDFSDVTPESSSSSSLSTSSSSDNTAPSSSAEAPPSKPKPGNNNVIV